MAAGPLELAQLRVVRREDGHLGRVRVRGRVWIRVGVKVRVRVRVRLRVRLRVRVRVRVRVRLRVRLRVRVRVSVRVVRRAYGTPHLAAQCAGAAARGIATAGAYRARRRRRARP